MIHLQDQHVFYPEVIHPDDVVAKINAVLARTLNEGNKSILLNPDLDLANFIQRACWKAGINPAVVLIALVRERGLLVNEAAADAHDWDYACGVVGSDNPGTVNDRWDGLLTQILMCCELTAWYIGVGPDSNFGYRVGLEPHAVGRWPVQQTVDILNERHQVVKAGHVCGCAAEYAQLTFTPHLGLGDPKLDPNTLDVNGQILQNHIQEFL